MEEKSQRMHMDLDRFSIWIVFAIAFFIVIVAVYQVRTTLYAPKQAAADRLAQAINQNNPSVNPEEQAAQIEADQTRDDDGDGLNNFEEVATYGTSPYLVDTDSDTISDAQEIQEGTDPNCPEGGDCQVVRVAGDGTTTEAQDEFSGLTPTITGDGAKQLSREEMEQALQQRGITTEQLAEMTDQQVQDAYLEVQQQVESGADSVAKMQETIDTLLALPIEEKRALLIESGVPTEDVESLSDEEINTLIQEAVDTIVSQQSTTPTAPADDKPQE